MDYDALFRKTLFELQKIDLTTEERNNHYKNLGFYYYSSTQPNAALMYFIRVEPKDFSTLRSIAAIYLTFDMNKSILYTERCLELQYDENIAYD